MRGEIAKLCLDVIARSKATTASAEAQRAKAEAIHSFLRRFSIVSLALAMTVVSVV